MRVRATAALLTVLAVSLSWGCGARPVSGIDLGSTDGATPLPSDTLADNVTLADGMSPDAEPDARNPTGCVEVAVRVGPGLLCDPVDPVRDCRGVLCVDLFRVNAPSGAPLARSCRAKVDLSGGKHAAMSLAFNAASLPPQTTLLVGAFLAEVAASAPAGPAKGDPALSVAAVSYVSATHCPWLDLVLDLRW